MESKLEKPRKKNTNAYMKEIHVNNNNIEITTTAANENNRIRTQLDLSVLTGAKPDY